MSDRTDDLIEALVRARKAGMSRDECRELVEDTFNAPWIERYKEPFEDEGHDRAA